MYYKGLTVILWYVIIISNLLVLSECVHHNVVAVLPDEKETSTNVADFRNKDTLSRTSSSPSDAVLNQSVAGSSSIYMINPTKEINFSMQTGIKSIYFKYNMSNEIHLFCNNNDDDDDDDGNNNNITIYMQMLKQLRGHTVRYISYSCVLCKCRSWQQYDGEIKMLAEII